MSSLLRSKSKQIAFLSLVVLRERSAPWIFNEFPKSSSSHINKNVYFIIVEASSSFGQLIHMSKDNNSQWTFRILLLSIIRCCHSFCCDWKFSLLSLIALCYMWGLFDTCSNHVINGELKKQSHIFYDFSRK